MLIATFRLYFGRDLEKHDFLSMTDSLRVDTFGATNLQFPPSPFFKFRAGLK